VPVTSHDEAVRWAFERSGLTPYQVWMRCASLGGNADAVEVDAYLHGLARPPRAEHDVLAHALNERLDELDEPLRRPGVPYSWSVPAGTDWPAAAPAGPAVDRRELALSARHRARRLREEAAQARRTAARARRTATPPSGDAGAVHDRAVLLRHRLVLLRARRAAALQARDAGRAPHGPDA
jgi:hypothetical protein